MTQHSDPEETDEPHPTGGADPASSDERVRQDLRARHLASDPAVEVPLTTGQLVGRQALAWGKEILTIVLIALVLSFLIKTFLFRAFFIPSGSMENTLQINDRIFVNLLVPQPIGLKRGDVVVFKDSQGWLSEEPVANKPSGWLNDVATFIGLAPDSSQQHLIKRVIGMPGDKIICCNSDGKLTVNGTAITEPYLFPGASPSDTTFSVTVPEGHLWVMGDHRNNSMDSRAHNSLNKTGFVPISDVEGRAVVIAWPLSRVGILGNYPDVFADVPDPQSESVSSPTPTPAGP
ncbi:S26 family signal peptidase [Arthrobacter alpinus]|uniref:Signal peptidase I n=1 Tax=Arthrobacter alpinus TaxID=656366 RepID=A0A0S2LYP1_9MICC|nr:S26 family signal peptidase [Arthrobacter alpinus]